MCLYIAFNDFLYIEYSFIIETYDSVVSKWSYTDLCHYIAHIIVMSSHSKQDHQWPLGCAYFCVLISSFFASVSFFVFLRNSGSHYIPKIFISVLISPNAEDIKLFLLCIDLRSCPSK